MYQTIKNYRAQMLEWGTHEMMLPIIRQIKSFPKFPYTIEELRCMPLGSLGRALHNFLEEQQLDLLKDYESHDVKHVLLGYDSTEEGEAAMQYFFLGNGSRSFPVLITVVITLTIMPEHWGIFRQAYDRGKRTPPLGGTDWFALLPKQTSEIKHELQLI
jgi:hypothetical protein